MTQTHSLCVHLAANAQQCLACFVDDHGRESFMCTGCSVERISEMLPTVSPVKIARSIRFDRCGHGLNPHGDVCHTCAQGVFFYAQVVKALAVFADKPFAMRLKVVLRKIEKTHWSLLQGNMRKPSDWTTAD